jgi:hypothetical protein
LVCSYRYICTAIWETIFFSLVKFVLRLTSLVSWTLTSVGHMFFSWFSEHVSLSCLLAKKPVHIHHGPNTFLIEEGWRKNYTWTPVHIYNSKISSLPKAVSPTEISYSIYSIP